MVTLPENLLVGARLEALVEVSLKFAFTGLTSEDLAGRHRASDLTPEIK